MWKCFEDLKAFQDFTKYWGLVEIVKITEGTGLANLTLSLYYYVTLKNKYNGWIEEKDVKMEGWMKVENM